MSNRSKIQDEILSDLKEPVHGLLVLAPRVGKTFMGIKILSKEKIKSALWVTSDVQNRDVAIPAEFKKQACSKTTGLFEKVKIVCYQSLHKIKGTYDKIILDEYQYVTPANVKNLLNGSLKAKSIVGLSGTHPKHSEKLALYKSLGLNILKNMTIDEAVDNKLIADYKLTFIGCKLNYIDKNVEAGNASNKFMQTEISMYNYLTRRIQQKKERGETVPKFYYLNRARFIYNLKSKNDAAREFVKNLKGRTLVFTGSIEQAEKMSKNTYHSKTTDDKLKLFMDGKLDTLACVNAGGVGLTYENVDNFVIVQVNSNKRGDITQKIARALLLQKDYKANIYVFYVKDTVDELWLNNLLEDFNGEIERVDYEQFKKRSYGPNYKL